MSSMGENIAEARRKAGLTQAELAEKMGVSPQAVSSWERDEYRPGTGRLVRLAEALGVSLNSLAEKDNPSFATRKEIFDWEHMRTFVKATAASLRLDNTLKALDFAIQAHGTQTRKNSDIPYVSHPLNLACHCLAMGIREDEVIAACLLHDVIEDCGVKEEDLPVSDEVKRLVVLLTHEKDDRRREKIMTAYFAGIAAEPKAALIKCVDRCHNLTTISWGLSRSRQTRCIQETEKYILPLLDVVKKTPEYNNAAWLLRYQIESMLDIYKRMF